MTRPAHTARLTLALWALTALAAAEGPVLLDRVVAVVDDAPILLSDLERVLALGSVERLEGETEEAWRRRALDELIEQRLRFHEVDRYGFVAAPPEAVEAQVEAIRGRLRDDRAFAERLAEVGLDEARLRHLVARQLRVNAYVEDRLRPRVFVDLDDVRAYYEGELRSEMEHRGEPLPPLEEVRELIRSLLRERRLNEEIVAWTAQLRAQADVRILLERPERELPPVVERLERGGG